MPLKWLWKLGRRYGPYYVKWKCQSNQGRGQAQGPKHSGSERASEASLRKAENVPMDQVPQKGPDDTELNKAMDVLPRGCWHQGGAHVCRAGMAIGDSLICPCKQLGF